MTDTPEGTPAEKPELIIDEDWKSQVQAEKQATEAAGATTSSPEPAPADSPSQDGAGSPPPPASFTGLVSMLALQAAAALGQLPDPVEGGPVVRPDMARHFIDLLGILETKTKGNLTQEEEQMLGGVVSDLRLAFVSVQAHPPESAK